MFAWLMTVGNSTDGTRNRLPGTLPPAESGDCVTSCAVARPAPVSSSDGEQAAEQAARRLASLGRCADWGSCGSILERIWWRQNGALDRGLQHDDGAAAE